MFSCLANQLVLLHVAMGEGPPKGPRRTKSTMDSKLLCMATVDRYGAGPEDVGLSTFLGEVTASRYG